MLKKTFICFTLMTLTTTVVASDHNEKHNHHAPITNIELSQGEKWPVDATLPIGMNKIKMAIEANLNAIHKDLFTPIQYKQLADKVDSQLAYLFEHCKLPQAADAQLHSLLFMIMQANQKMRSNEHPRSGAVSIIKALQEYPKYFDDKTWQPLQH